MKVAKLALIEDLPLLNNMKYFGTTGNENFGSSFGDDPPPPSIGGEFANDYCYVVLKTDTLVLKRDAGLVDIRQPCRWQIESYSQTKVLFASSESEPCNKDNCPPSENLGDLSIEVVDSEGDEKTACELLNNIDSDFKLKVKQITHYRGCIDFITEKLNQESHRWWNFGKHWTGS